MRRDNCVYTQGKDQMFLKHLYRMTFFWHSFSRLCRSHCVESNLAWFHIASRWSQQMPKSKHPVHGQVMSKQFCMIMTQSKPVYRPLGNQTAHRCIQVIWPWHIIGVYVCVHEVWSCLDPGNWPYFCYTAPVLPANDKPLFPGRQALLASWLLLCDFESWSWFVMRVVILRHLSCLLIHYLIQLRYESINSQWISHVHDGFNAWCWK